MSIAAACAEALASVQRARSLFTADAQVPLAAEQCPEVLHHAALGAAAAGTKTSGLSGYMVNQHRTFVDRATTAITTASRTDSQLHAHLTQAAAITRAGAAQLDTVEQRTTATVQAGRTAKTAAAQRAVLTALKQHVDDAQQIVHTAQQQADELAGQTKALTYGNSREPRQSGPDDQIVGPRDGITAQNVDNIKEGPELPPPPPPDRPRLTGAPGPLQDFTDYQLNGQPIPNPPAENVTAEDLRLRLLQQRIDYNDFVKWFNDKHGGTTTPEEMLTKIAVFEGSSVTLAGSLAALPEGIPLTVGAAILWLASGYDLAMADPGTARIPEMGP